MQEVGGSIPPGSTTLRPLGFAWRSPEMPKGRKRGARRSPQGEDGLRQTMWYVYIIRSENFPEQEYIGATADLKRRLPEHNAGKSAHIAKFKPWKLVWYCAFPDKYKALEFEKYLKSHSGRAFAKKRF
jgi:putative endonuclease